MIPYGVGSSERCFPVDETVYNIIVDQNATGTEEHES